MRLSRLYRLAKDKVFFAFNGFKSAVRQFMTAVAIALMFVMMLIMYGIAAFVLFVVSKLFVRRAVDKVFECDE